jgi:hypothetical protein
MSATALDDAAGQEQRHRWSDLAARLALHGIPAWRSDAQDGVQRFFIARHGLVQLLPDADAVIAFLDVLERRTS